VCGGQAMAKTVQRFQSYDMTQHKTPLNRNPYDLREKCIGYKMGSLLSAMLIAIYFAQLNI
jgi:hypothetical protein